MAFSFGTPAANNKPATSFNFGSSTPAQSAPLFGGSQNNSATAANSFSFGSTNPNTAQDSAQTRPAFSFGNSTPSASNTAPAFSFGTSSNGQQTAAGSLFASGPGSAPNPSNGLFGQTGNNSNTGSMFGTQQNGLTSNVGGQFGQQSQQQAGSNLLGQSGAQAPMMFGQSVQPQTNSFFGATGNTNQQQMSTGFFGNTGQPQNQVQASNPQQAHVPQVSMAQSIYGQTSSQPQFSWSRPSQSGAQSLMPSFRMPSMSLAQSKSAQGHPSASVPGVSVNASQTTYGPSQPASIQDQLLRLKNAWDHSAPDCMFQAYFYNRVAPETASLYTKPDDHKQRAWEEAVANRPDNSVVPVLARGFTDLQSRVRGQEQQIYAYRTRIHEIANKLKELSDRHELHAMPKIDAAKRRHIEISRRALQLAAKVQVLKCRGYALRPEEDQMRTQFQALEKRLHEPKTFGRIDELWAKMTLLKFQQKSIEEEVKARGYITTIDFENEDGLIQIEQVLQDHNNGLSFIDGVLTDDLGKVDARMHEYQVSKAGLDKSKGR